MRRDDEQNQSFLGEPHVVSSPFIGGSSMPLSWNEIKDRALRFSREWAGEASEDAEAQSFWNGFFDVFGVSRRRVANFERKVKKIDGRDGYIDLLWKGVLPKLSSDTERVAFLFERYQALTSLLPAAKPAKPRRKKTKVTT
ncbi:MAG TPA: type IIL restriction-modification enzyme MmeI [Rhodanobacteraceae bacterium]